MEPKGITVVDVMRKMGVIPVKELTWPIGARVRDIYKEKTGELPKKGLRPKTNRNALRTDGREGAATHCFAVYPEEWSPVIEQVIKDVTGMSRPKYKLGKVDLRQIECRILNTLAGQWDVVEKFRDGVDIYSLLATEFYGFLVDESKPAERGTGKQLELSCGYGAGGPTIVRTARAGTYGPPVRLTDSQGMQARDLYRRTHPFVVALWERASQILWTLMAGHTMEWGPPGQSEPCMVIKDHRIFLPGGLWLDFTSLKRERIERPQDQAFHSGGEEVWLHRVREGWRKTYGARLIENVVQALARIVISQAMVRIMEMGYRIPLTVHDDVFILIPANEGGLEPVEHLARCAAVVGQELPWMPACPIAVETALLDALDK